MSMWNYDATNLENVKTPTEIVNEQCQELSDLTEGRVLARITEYDGEFNSYSALSYSQAITSGIASNVMDSILIPPSFDVQEVMGDKANKGQNNNFVYELFVTSKKTPKYKYRVLILYYGIGMYPVGLTIQKDIADEIGFKSEGMRFKDEDSFIEALTKILGSKTLGNIIRNLAMLNI